LGASPYYDYDDLGVCTILRKSSSRNIWLALAQQLIAAMFNAENVLPETVVKDAIIKANKLLSCNLSGKADSPNSMYCIYLLATTTPSRPSSALRADIDSLIGTLDEYNNNGNDGTTSCIDVDFTPYLAATFNSTPITKTCTQARKDCTDTLTAANKSLTTDKKTCLTKVGCKGSARSCKGANKSCNDLFKAGKKFAQTNAKQCRANAKGKIGCV
jgi:hypothetical protein